MGPNDPRPARLEQLLGIGASRLGTVRVRSALNPFLWLAGCSSPIGVVAGLFADDPIARYVLLAVGTAPTLLAVIAGLIFLFGDRDRLQSEEFVLEQRRIAIMAQKGGSPGTITRIDPATVSDSEVSDIFEERSER